MKKIFTLAALLMAASAVNAQYITKALDDNDESTFDWSKASNFVIFSVGEAEQEAMEGKILADYGINDMNRHLYIWENTYVGGDGTGMNSFGQLEDHIALTVSNVGWSGMGMIQDEGIDLSFLDDTYVLHFAMKAKATDFTSHGFGLAQAKFSIGPTAFVDGATTHKLLGDIEHNGEWYYIDIPWSVLKQCAANGEPFPADKGGSTAYNDNHFWVLSGGTQGAELHIDNIFFYKDSTITPPEPKFDKGDVNGDNAIDVTDINIIINIMLGKDSADNYDGRANVDGEGLIDVADINAIVNAMLGK